MALFLHSERALSRLSKTKPGKLYLGIGLRIICILYLSIHPFVSTNTWKGVKRNLDPSYWNVYHSVEQLASKLEVWEHKDLKEFPICRLERICRTHDGLWILPKWLNEYHSLLEKCGISDSSVWYADVKDSIHLQNNSFEGDLIGTQIVRWQLPHFIADTIWILLWRHFMYYTENTKMKPWSFMCFSPTSKSCITTHFWSALEPVFLNDQKLRQEDWTSQYLHQVLFRTIPSQWKTIPSDFSRCFRSVTFSKIRPSHVPKNILSNEDMFFRESGILREDRLRSSFQNAQKTGRCMVTFALKNNGIVADATNLPTSSSNDLFGQLASLIPQVASTSIDDSYQSKIHIRLVDFDSRNLDDWNHVKEKLQGVDVVVTDHSVANSQFLFLRPNTTVVEVLPFSYPAAMFRELASSLGLDYHAVSSSPDEETFLNCLFQYEQNHELVSELVQAYRQEAEKWRGGNYKPMLRLDKPETTDKVRMSRHCARQQRIFANVTEIALFVVQRALTPCLTGLWYHQHAT